VTAPAVVQIMRRARNTLSGATLTSIAPYHAITEWMFLPSPPTPGNVLVLELVAVPAATPLIDGWDLQDTFLTAATTHNPPNFPSYQAAINIYTRVVASAAEQKLPLEFGPLATWAWLVREVSDLAVPVVVEASQGQLGSAGRPQSGVSVPPGVGNCLTVAGIHLIGTTFASPSITEVVLRSSSAPAFTDATQRFLYGLSQSEVVGSDTGRKTVAGAFWDWVTTRVPVGEFIENNIEPGDRWAAYVLTFQAADPPEAEGAEQALIQSRTSTTWPPTVLNDIIPGSWAMVTRASSFQRAWVQFRNEQIPVIGHTVTGYALYVNVSSLSDSHGTYDLVLRYKDTADWPIDEDDFVSAASLPGAEALRIPLDSLIGFRPTMTFPLDDDSGVASSGYTGFTLSLESPTGWGAAPTTQTTLTLTTARVVPIVDATVPTGPPGQPLTPGNRYIATLPRSGPDGGHTIVMRVLTAEYQDGETLVRATMSLEADAEAQADQRAPAPVRLRTPTSESLDHVQVAQADQAKTLEKQMFGGGA
jgi:hypothetical protein